jgi:molecular chaperone GrpE
MSHKNQHNTSVNSSGTQPEQNASPVSEPAPAAPTATTPAPAPKTPSTTKIIKLTEPEHEKLKTDAAKAAENWDKFLRASADFDNYRKRVTREKEELTRSARETVIASLLPALDNLERALDHSPEGTPLHDGLLQVQKQFDRSLAEFGLAEITVKPGDAFNPNLHEAISHLESNDQPDGAIIQQVQSGYKLAEKLIRPARVVVSKGKGDTTDKTAAESETPAEPKSENKTDAAADKKNPWFKSPFTK